MTALVVLAAAWLAGGLAAVLGWPLWARWLAAAVVWPLLPVSILILISPRLGHRRVSLTIALVGAGTCAIAWRPALIEAATTHAGWMIDDDGSSTPGESATHPGSSQPVPSTPVPSTPVPATPIDESRPPTPVDEHPPSPVIEPPLPSAESDGEGGPSTKGCFRELVTTPHSDFAYGTTLADMDGDSLLDAVWVHSGSDDQLKIWSGDRSGVFKPTSAVDYDGGGLSVAIADYDRDGSLDVATCDYRKATVTLWMGAGDGTLNRGASYKTYRSPLAATTADLDADGHADLIVSHYFHVEVLRGSASGKLRTSPWLRLVKSKDDPKRLLTPEDIAAADLNGDGLLDLVIPKGDVRSVEVWVGRSGGKLHRSADAESCSAPSRTLVGDVDEDGDQDVIVSCGANLELLVGDGAGGLERRGEIGPAHAYQGGALADFNGDGHLDLLAPTIPAGVKPVGFDGGGGRLGLHLGDGEGRFLEAEEAIELSGQQHRIIAIADIDGDEHLDVAYECFGQRPGAHIGVVFGTGCDPAQAP